MSSIHITTSSPVFSCRPLATLYSTYSHVTMMRYVRLRCVCEDSRVEDGVRDSDSAVISTSSVLRQIRAESSPTCSVVDFQTAVAV